MSKTNQGFIYGKSGFAFLFTCIYCLIATHAVAQLPDLIINKPRLAASVELQRVTFSSSDCSVVEGCVPEGVRKLLKFDVGFQNAGNGDLVIGDPNARPDLFEPSTCHGHFHMSGVANYELLSASGQSVLVARKQGWCFRDDHRFRQGAGPAKFNCNHQGISAGWEDVYDKSLDCQWLDVTGLPGGKYLLRVVVNPDQVFEESNYGNNVATVQVTLPETSQVTTPGTGNPQPPQAKTPPKAKAKAKPAKNKKWESAWKKLKDKFKHKKPKKQKNKGKGNGQGQVHDKHDSDKDDD